MRTIDQCRVCYSDKLVDVLSLGSIHFSGFVDDPKQELPKYPLDLVFCERCKLAQLRHTVPAETMYREYWYRSGTNRSMTDELRGIAKQGETYLSMGDIALDIGCNDGTLLRSYSKGIFTAGFEPASNLFDFASTGTDVVINDFFSAEAWRVRMGDKKAKVVTTIAMFYDLDDPNSFVRDVYEVLEDRGVWIIQMADLKSMLERRMWDNICHEHLEYYSLISLEYLLRCHGFEVEDIQHNDVNGGSIRVTVVKQQHANVRTSVELFREAELAMHLDTNEPYETFSTRVHEANRLLVEFVRKAATEGKKVYVYGASTKGNTLLQCTGLDSSLITAAAERNPHKWGKYTVGTHIPIVSEEEARAAKPDYFLVLPWHFMNEFVEREREYLRGGGKFIVPLPAFRIVSG